MRLQNHPPPPPPPPPPPNPLTDGDTGDGNEVGQDVGPDWLSAAAPTSLGKEVQQRKHLVLAHSLGGGGGGGGGGEGRGGEGRGGEGGLGTTNMQTGCCMYM